MKPTAWQALVLAMALVLSVREVAPAIYDRTTATFPLKNPKPSKGSCKYHVHIIKLLSDIYFRGLFLILQDNKSQHSLQYFYPTAQLHNFVTNHYGPTLCFVKYYILIHIMVNLVLKLHVNNLTRDTECNDFQKCKSCCVYLLQTPREHGQSACSTCCGNGAHGRRHRDN